MLSASVKVGTEAPFRSRHEIDDPFELLWSGSDFHVAVLPAGQKIVLTICGLAIAARFNTPPNAHPPKKIMSKPMSNCHTNSCQTIFMIVFLAKKTGMGYSEYTIAQETE